MPIHGDGKRPRAAGKLAYEYLIELNGPGVDDSIDAALATLGCFRALVDAPVALGLDYGTGGRGFACVANGAEAGRTLCEVLYAVGEPRSVRDAAAAFATEMASIPVDEANAMTIERSVAQPCTWRDCRHVGAVRLFRRPRPEHRCATRSMAYHWLGS